MKPTENKDEIEVTLLKDGHTHAERECKKGETITVTRAQAEFLAAHDLIAKPAAGKKE